MALMNNFYYLLIFGFCSTILITFLGSVFAVFSRKLNKNFISILNAFTVGIITSLLFFELIPEALEGFKTLFNKEIYGVLISVGIIGATFIVFFGLHELMDKIIEHKNHNEEENEEICENHIHTHEMIESKSKLFSSFIFISAIVIHNIPEGLAQGSFFNTQGFPYEGLFISLSLLFHNFTIGYSITNSFKETNKSNLYSILTSVISSLPAFVFSIIGYFLLTNLGETTTSIMFAISSGSLIYVLFKELLPTALSKYKSKFTYIFLLLGILIGIIFIYL